MDIIHNGVLGNYTRVVHFMGNSSIMLWSPKLSEILEKSSKTKQHIKHDNKKRT